MFLINVCTALLWLMGLSFHSDLLCWTQYLSSALPFFDQCLSVLPSLLFFFSHSVCCSRSKKVVFHEKKCLYSAIYSNAIEIDEQSQTAVLLTCNTSKQFIFIVLKRHLFGVHFTFCHQFRVVGVGLFFKVMYFCREWMMCQYSLNMHFG